METCQKCPKLHRTNFTQCLTNKRCPWYGQRKLQLANSAMALLQEKRPKGQES